MATICGQIWDESRRQWVFTTCFADGRKFHRDEIRKELRAKYPGRQTRLLVSDDDHVGAGVVCDCDGTSCECKGVEKAKDPREVLNNLTDALSDYLEVTGPHAAQGTGDDLDEDPADRVGENDLSDRTSRDDEEIVAARYQRRERHRQAIATELRQLRAIGNGGLAARSREQDLLHALAQLAPQQRGASRTYKMLQDTHRAT